MALDVNLPDLNYEDIAKAAIGAMITLIGAVLFEVRRRRRERKNRLQDDKRRIYTHFLHYTDLFFADMQLAAAFMPIYTRLKLSSGEGNHADLEQAREIVERIERNLPKYREEVFKTLTEMELIWPGSRKASANMMGVLVVAGELLRQERYEKIANLTENYNRGRASFQAQARRDLRITTWSSTIQ